MGRKLPNCLEYGEANFEAILAMIQNRVLESLRAGKPLADLHKDLLRGHKINSAFPNPEPTTEDLLKLQQQLERQQEKQLKEKEISNQNPSTTPTISTISNNFQTTNNPGQNL